MISKRSAAVLLLAIHIFCVQPRQAHAYAPAVITAGMLGSALIVGTLATLYKPGTLPSGWSTESILTSGYNVARVVVGAQLAANQYGTNVLYGNYLAVKAGLSELIAAFNPADPGTQVNRDSYPKMFDYLYKDLAYPPIGANDYVPGKCYETEIGLRKVLKVTGPHTMTFQWSNNGFYLDSAASGTFINVVYPQYWSITTSSVGPPVPTAKTVDEIKLATPENTLPPAVATDFDNMIKNAAGPLTVVDTARPEGVDGAPPFVPTPIPGDATVNPAAPTVTGLNNPAVTATGNALTTSQATLQTQQAAINDYKVAHPDSTAENDPALQEMIEELEKINAEVTANTKAYESAIAQDKEVYQNANIEALKTLNFESLKGLAGAMNDVFPFKLLPQIAGLLDVLVREPQAPAFDVNLPLGNTVHVDLTAFDTLAFVCRFLVGLLLTFGVVYYVIRFYRGVS